MTMDEMRPILPEMDKIPYFSVECWGNKYIIGRMGMPYREKNVSVISIVMDAPNNVISAVSGKLGMLDGVSAKAVYSKK